MSNGITGLHHISAITSEIQKNIDFYHKILGLHLVKQTVNFDNPQVYHFYYGNAEAAPGSLITFFPYTGLVNGRHGKGMMNTTAFVLPMNALNFWEERLKKFSIPHKNPVERFKEEIVIYFEDYDGLGLELVFTHITAGNKSPLKDIPDDMSIQSIYSAELWLEGYERTAGILTGFLGYEMVNSSGSRFRFANPHDKGRYIDLICAPDNLKGLSGSGSYHHIAFNIATEEALQELYQKLKELNVNPTPVLDRKYFKSVYFREPGGVLFEIATSGPGFAIDEPPGELGRQLKIPEHLSSETEFLKSKLPPVDLSSSLISGYA